VIDAEWFAGEGVGAVVTAAFFFAVAVGTLAWLRGPGSDPHDPPIARDAVRWFALLAALFGALWLVRAILGIGGFAVVAAALLAVSVAMIARQRARRS